MTLTVDTIRNIRCSNCGRFLGKGRILEGEIYLLCAKCKYWTVVTEGDTELKLTGKDIYTIIENKKYSHSKT